MRKTIRALDDWERDALEYAMREFDGTPETEDPARSTAWSGLRNLYDRAEREANEPRVYAGRYGLRLGKFGRFLYVTWSLFRARPGHPGWQRRLEIRVLGHGFSIPLRTRERLL